MASQTENSSDPTPNEPNIIWDDGRQPVQPDTDTIPPPDRPLLTPAAHARRWINVTLGIVLRNTRFQLEVHEAVNNSVLMTKQDLQQFIPSTTPTIPEKLVIRLIQDDTLGAVHALHQQDPTSKIAILNFANNTVAGGGVLNGAQAQEENICLRTSLHRSLHCRFYPLPDDQIIYSSDILVAKLNSPTDPLDGILLREQDQYLIDVISCAAVRRPATIVGPDGLTTYSNQQDKDLMQLKLETIISSACTNNVQKLVLGAFGCGVFQNPPHAVAKLMRALLLGSLPPTRSQSAVAVQSPPAPLPTTRPRGRGKKGNSAPALAPEPIQTQTQAEQPPPMTMPHITCFDLNEIIIPILDTNIAANQPTWNAFVDVFRDVAHIILPQGAIIGDVEEIAHHVFSVPGPVLMPSIEGNDTGFGSFSEGSILEGTILTGDDSGISRAGGVRTLNPTGGDANADVNEPRSLPRPRAQARPIVGKVFR